MTQNKRTMKHIIISVSGGVAEVAVNETCGLDVTVEIVDFDNLNEGQSLEGFSEAARKYIAQEMVQAGGTKDETAWEDRQIP